MGDRFRLLGSVEDLSLQVEKLNGVTDGVEKLRDGEKVLLRELRKRSEDWPVVVSSGDPDENDLAKLTGMSKASVNRLLGPLMAVPEYGVKRKRIATQKKGIQPFGYWAES
jgi:hypothetical protein